MAWAEEDLATIRAAIAHGTKAVTFADGRKQEYQSLDHLIAAEAVIAAALKQQAQMTAGAVRRRFAPYYKSGL